MKKTAFIDIVKEMVLEEATKITKKFSKAVEAYKAVELEMQSLVKDFVAEKDPKKKDKLKDTLKSLTKKKKQIEAAFNAALASEPVELEEATVVMDAMNPDDKAFLRFLKKNKVKIINKEMEGPAGGAPVITMQGKRKDLEAVLADDKYGWDDPDLAGYIKESEEVNEGKDPGIKGKWIKVEWNPDKWDDYGKGEYKFTFRRNKNTDSPGKSYKVRGRDYHDAQNALMKKSGKNWSNSMMSMMLLHDLTMYLKESVNESTEAYEKALIKIAKDRQLKMLSKKDKETLLKVAQMMKSANESANEDSKAEDLLKQLYKQRAKAAAKGQTGLVSSLHKQIEKLIKSIKKNESINEAIIKFTREEMAKLHKDGKLEKDGDSFVYKESVNEDLIGPFAFNNSTSDEKLQQMYDAALDGYANWSKGMKYPKSKYKQAYQAIEKLAKKKDIKLESVNEAKEYYVTYNRGRGQGKGLINISDTNKPKVFKSYKDAEKWVKAMSGGPSMVAYWVSDKDMNSITK